MGIVSKVVLGVVVFAAAGKLIQHGNRALGPSLPKDMPARSSFIQSGFNLQKNEALGQWVVCGQDVAQNTNYCKVSDAHGVIVYQGDYLPIGRQDPLPTDSLRVSKIVTSSSMWVSGPNDQGPVPVFALQGGDVLVPAADREALQDRWNRHPEELQSVQSGE